MQKIKQLLTVLALTLGLLAPVALATPAHALFEGLKDDACRGAALDETANCNTDTANAAGSFLSIRIRQIINVLCWIVGVAAVFMIIIGGFRYVTSSGDSNSVNGAKNTILFAIIGLIIVVMAQVVVRFVLKKV